MLSYVIDAALSISPSRVVVVTGPDQDAVADILPVGCERAVQQERRGTGDAVRAGLEPLRDFEGDVMVLYGDVPLVDAGFVGRTVRPATRRPRRPPPHHGAPWTIRPTTAASCATRRAAWRASSSTGTPTPDERDIDEINVGLYVFRADALRPALQRLGQRQRAGRAVPHRRRPPAHRRRSTWWPPTRATTRRCAWA